MKPLSSEDARGTRGDGPHTRVLRPRPRSGGTSLSAHAAFEGERARQVLRPQTPALVSFPKPWVPARGCSLTKPALRGRRAQSLERASLAWPLGVCRLWVRQVFLLSGYDSGGTGWAEAQSAVLGLFLPGR